jgi:glycosyltransferase involved in cell wall biosynthesis
MKILIWQNRPNLHDFAMYAGLAKHGFEVRFIWDVSNDLRGALQRSDIEVFDHLDLSRDNWFGILKMVLWADTNIIVGGIGFTSTRIAHLLCKLDTKIFVSEGRFDWSLKHRLLACFERVLCRSSMLLSIGENGADYFSKTFGSSASVKPWAYFYLENIGWDEVIPPRRDILFLGRWHSDKGISTLLNLSKALPHLQFTFAGSGKHPANVADFENTRFVAEVSQAQIPRLLHEHAILLLPSIREPYGCVVQEAIAANRLAIVSKRAGARELGRKYPTHVIAVDPVDIASIAQTICENLDRAWQPQPIPELWKSFSTQQGIKLLSTLLRNRVKNLQCS